MLLNSLHNLIKFHHIPSTPTGLLFILTNWTAFGFLFVLSVSRKFFIMLTILIASLKSFYIYFTIFFWTVTNRIVIFLQDVCCISRRFLGCLLFCGLVWTNSTLLDTCLPAMFRPEDDRLWHICQRWCTNQLHVHAYQLIICFPSMCNSSC